MREEQRSLFQPKRKAPAAAATTSWSHGFVCLHSTTADRVPTNQSAKLLLEEAGLGQKLIRVPDLDCGPEAFSKLLLAAYPRLHLGGGFEPLRCKAQSRELLLISPRISNNPRLLKRRVANGKVYIRPIQRDLSLEPEEEDEDMEGLSVFK